jgi:hypothetical protein
MFAFTRITKTLRLDVKQVINMNFTFCSVFNQNIERGHEETWQEETIRPQSRRWSWM